MNPLPTLSIPSTLPGATVRSAEGNEFSNTGRDTIKITVQNINIDHGTVGPESEYRSGGNIENGNKNLQTVSGPGTSDFGIYSALSTMLAAIFGHRSIQPPLIVDEPTCSDDSSLLLRDTFTDRALDGDFEPAATICDISAHDSFSFSSSPSIITERYTRSMLDCQCTAGYPLYEPRPDSGPSTEYWKEGVRIGDVGMVTEDGIFDFLFNVCPSQNPSINPLKLPEDFEALEFTEIREMEQHFKMQTHLFNNTVTRIQESEVRYKCLGPEGAILELPAGATLFEAKDKLSFKRLASRHAEKWYKYAIVSRGRDAPNGSLYLVTSCIKCTHWGIAVFDRPSAPQDYLQFIENDILVTANRNLHFKYDWNGSGAFVARVPRDSDIPDLRDGNGLNQCVFLRGYKIMLRKDVWDNVIDPHSTGTPWIKATSSSANLGTKWQTRQSDSNNPNNSPRHENGGSSEFNGGTSRQYTSESGMKPMEVDTVVEAERVIMLADFSAPPLHPSDFINTVLLSQESGARVALTHDDDWWNLLQDSEGVAKTASSYTSVIDENGSVSLELASDQNSTDKTPSIRMDHISLPFPRVASTGPVHPAAMPDEWSASTRGDSPAPAPHRGVSQMQQSYAHNRHFRVSSPLEHRELIRNATSMLCREMARPPPHMIKTENGLRDWEEVERRIGALKRLDRVWTKSGAVGGTILNAAGEDRERKLFADALRDGYILCHLINKLRSSSVVRPDAREDDIFRSSNVTNFLAACASYGLPSEDLFQPDDLTGATSKTLSRVAKTIIAVINYVETPLPSKILSGQGKKQASVPVPVPYKGSMSRASASTPNLFYVPSSPPSSPTRRRWSPPSALPPVKLNSSEEGSAENSPRFSNDVGDLRSEQSIYAKLDAPVPSIVPPPRSALRPRINYVETPLPSKISGLGKEQASVPVPVPYQGSTSRAFASTPNLFHVPSSSLSYPTPSTLPLVKSNVSEEGPAENSLEMLISKDFGDEQLTYGKLDTPVSSLVPPVLRPQPIRQTRATTAYQPRRSVLRPRSTRRTEIGSKEASMAYHDHADFAMHLNKGRWPDDFMDHLGQPMASPLEVQTPLELDENFSYSALTPQALHRVEITRRNEELPTSDRLKQSQNSRPAADSAALIKREKGLLRRGMSSDKVGPTRTMLRRHSTKLGQQSAIYLPRSNLRHADNDDASVPCQRAAPREHAHGGPSSIDRSNVRKAIIVQEPGKPPVQYRLGNCIGRGQFGSVYRALNLSTGQTVAVKQIRLEGLKEAEVTELMREVNICKRLSHPGIVRYEGMTRDEKTLSIVLEYAENGSLGQTLKAYGKLNERLAASFVTRILEGLHYLHGQDVVHYDLKAANILTTKTGNVKLTDFGVSLNLRAMEREITNVAGTLNWMAPEIIELKGASAKSDIWSLACTVIELLTGRPPYAEISNTMTVMFRIVEDKMPPMPEECSDLARDFLLKCFNKDPAQRPSAEILFEHPWLKQNWGIHKELRPQDSIPFLRRVSADLQKSDAIRYLPISCSPESPGVLKGSPIGQSPIEQCSSASSVLPLGENDFSPREHSFVKTTFSKAMHCRVCSKDVKKTAVICAQCSLVSHSKCAPSAPPTCDLRAQLLQLAQYAEIGSPTSLYHNPVDALGSNRPPGAMSDVPYVTHPDNPQPTQSANVAVKFMSAFKRSRSNLADAGTSVVSTPPQARTTNSRDDKVVRREGAFHSRDKDRPLSLSSNSTGVSSVRSAATTAESFSSGRDTLASYLSRISIDRPVHRNNEIERTAYKARTPPRVATIDVDNTPKAVPPEVPSKKRESRTNGNCIVQ